MDAGMMFWNLFLGFCIVAIMACIYASYRRDARDMRITLDAPAQPPAPPPAIAVHVHLTLPSSPTGDEIGAGVVRQIQQAAARQIEAQGHRVDWHVVEDGRERLPVDVQPRLGNRKNEIEVRR